MGRRDWEKGLACNYVLWLRIGLGLYCLKGVFCVSVVFQVGFFAWHLSSC